MPSASCRRNSVDAPPKWPPALAGEDTRLGCLATGSAMTLLADVVTASRDLTDTSSRSGKVAILAELLGRLDASEIAVAVGFLAGVPRQGRVGIGYSTIYGIERAPAREASLTIDELDRAIAVVQGMTGSGSAGKRKQILGELVGRATDEEAGFVKRLLTGELRQGALAGLMVDAIGRAAGVSAELARRALMLTSDLTRTAEIAITRARTGFARWGSRSSGPSFRCSPPPRRACPRRLGASIVRRWSGSSTESGSRSIAAMRRSASTPATSMTSRTRCPGSPPRCAACL